MVKEYARHLEPSTDAKEHIFSLSFLLCFVYVPYPFWLLMMVLSKYITTNFLCLI